MADLTKATTFIQNDEGEHVNW